MFIFSDKDCAFPNSGDVATDWSRWFKRAIWQSAKQVWGAERSIRDHPDRLFLDSGCTQPLPIPLPPVDQAVFHRIVVAHGSKLACRTLLGGSGSLMLAPAIVGTAHFNREAPNFLPFAVGHLSATKGYVHVIDDFTLDTVLSTIDTAADLARYFQRKEELILSGKLGMAAGEEELLANFLRHTDDEGQHCFQFPQSFTKVFVDEGFWDRFCKHPDRLAQIEADRVSYAWDELIDEFTKHALAGTQYFTSDASVAAHEKALRLMAREPRTVRRILAKSLLAVLKRADTEERSARVVTPFLPGDPHYLFLALRPPEDKAYDEYRVVRRNLLEAYCLVARLKFPEARDVVGIATEPLSWQQTGSEDLVYLDGAHWTAETANEAAALQQKLGLLQEVLQFEANETEYPSATGSRKPA
ncbi:MAG: hypothetical protein Q7T33_10570 [Dehalococcoidia bacterium]|nr:hypothetical protein [Dehalococcoidia bacterium]